MVEQIEKLTGKVEEYREREDLTKGQTAIGKIVKIEQGLATDFHTPEQIEKRQVNADDQFIQLTICEPVSDRLFRTTFRYFEGSVHPKSTMGQILSVYGEIEEGSELNLIAREINPRDGEKFCVWDIIL